MMSTSKFQEKELEKLKLIYGNKILDLRTTSNQPLDLRIVFKEHILCDRHFDYKYCDFNLRVKCDSVGAPTVSIENCCNIPSYVIENVNKRLQNRTENLKEETSEKIMIENSIDYALDLIEFYYLLLTSNLNSSYSMTKNLLKMKKKFNRKIRMNKENDSNILNFPNFGRKILKGQFLKSSKTGYTAFSGTDLETKKLVYITEWCIPHSRIQNNAKEIISNIESKFFKLKQLSHKNLVRYECFRAINSSNQILVILVQEYVTGVNIRNLLFNFGSTYENVSFIIKEVLDTLLYLRKNDLLCLNDQTMFYDNSGLIRITNYELVPYLIELISGEKQTISGIPSFENFIKSLPLSPSTDLKNLIEKCSSIQIDDYDFKSLTEYCFGLCKSKLHDEFKIFACLGRGAYGVVVKAQKTAIDSQFYAIKKIVVAVERKNKILREAELLSTLNHDNVVRYYDCWIAKCDCKDDWEINDTEDCECYEDEIINKNDTTEKSFLYIQMEFCEKTLETVIANDLYVDLKQVWRYFREIVNGLAYIQQNDIIHRDLKPANIFIDCSNKVKIGDFGFATTKELLRQSKIKFDNINKNNRTEIYGSPTAYPGTIFYNAPELTGNAAELFYNFKVDMYSLGIILFEMSYPPMKTCQERCEIASIIKNKKFTLPSEFGLKSAIRNNEIIKVLKKLLNHNPDKRPSAKDILSLKLIPLTNEEIDDRQSWYKDQVRKTISNPGLTTSVSNEKSIQSKQIDHDSVYYRQQHVSSFLKVDYCKSKLIGICQTHGATEIATPLLLPCNENDKTNKNTVRLMTDSTEIVCLPSDIRTPFVRHVAANGIDLFRRYSIEQVLRGTTTELHKPSYELTFDIITPISKTLIVDAENILIPFEMIKKFPIFQRKNIKLSIEINHTDLLQAVLLYFDIPPDKREFWNKLWLDFMNGKNNKKLLKLSINDICETPEQRTDLTLKMMNICKYFKTIPVNELNIQELLGGDHNAIELARKALTDLECVVEQAKEFGVTCTLKFNPSLSLGFNGVNTGGVIWQLSANQYGKKRRLWNKQILAEGGRYDNDISKYQKEFIKCDPNTPEHNICGVGFNMKLDKLFTPQIDFYGKSSKIDIAICITVGNPQPPNDLTIILKSLWRQKIRTGIIEISNKDEAAYNATKAGALHFILFGGNGEFIYDSTIFDTTRRTSQKFLKIIQTILDPYKHKMLYSPTMYHSDCY